MILPDVLWMSRGGLLDWVSALVRVGISLLLLFVGWWLYCAIARIGGLLWHSREALGEGMPHCGGTEQQDARPETARTPSQGERVISLLVATRNRVAELDRLLGSLTGQSYRDFEVIVVDQNPDHRLVPVLHRHAGLRIRRLPSEPGLSRARNAGLRVARGDILALPDDDCWYPEHLLAEIGAWFASHPRFALLSGAVRTAENRPSGPRAPATPCACTPSNVWRCAVSTALFLRRSVPSAVGDFDEEIFLGSASAYQSGEETEFIFMSF
jgi:hypothetical protein